MRLLRPIWTNPSSLETRGHSQSPSTLTQRLDYNIMHVYACAWILELVSILAIIIRPFAALLYNL